MLRSGGGYTDVPAWESPPEQDETPAKTRRKLDVLDFLDVLMPFFTFLKRPVS
jgi:hypothetical protein